MKGAKTLSLYDPAEELVLVVDASTKGLGTCLMQGRRLCLYALHKDQSQLQQHGERMSHGFVLVLSISSHSVMRDP